jgi:hypothetical protein
MSPRNNDSTFRALHVSIFELCDGVVVGGECHRPASYYALITRAVMLIWQISGQAEGVEREETKGGLFSFSIAHVRVYAWALGHRWRFLICPGPLAQANLCLSSTLCFKSSSASLSVASLSSLHNVLALARSLALPVFF